MCVLGVKSLFLFLYPEIISRGSWGFSAGDHNWVDHVQNKCFSCYTATPGIYKWKKVFLQKYVQMILLQKNSR